MFFINFFLRRVELCNLSLLVRALKEIVLGSGVGQCSKPCDGGDRQREVMCISNGTRSNDVTHCNSAHVQSAVESCNNDIPCNDGRYHQTLHNGASVVDLAQNDS